MRHGTKVFNLAEAQNAAFVNEGLWKTEDAVELDSCVEGLLRGRIRGDNSHGLT